MPGRTTPGYYAMNSMVDEAAIKFIERWGAGTIPRSPITHSRCSVSPDDESGKCCRAMPFLRVKKRKLS